MDAVIFFTFLKENLLAVIAIIITLVFIYHYIIEKEHGVKLTKKYRNNIIETQSKIFLNATQYLISGDKNLAIKEFLSAVDLNRETIDTYFALGGLFRSNYNLERETTKNIELGLALDRDTWRLDSAIFYRQDKDLTDWTYSLDSTSARSANPVDIHWV